MRYIGMIIVALFIGCSIQAQSEIESIHETLNNYINGSTGGKPDILKKAFHSDLNLYSVRNNKVTVWSGVEYILDTKEGQPTGENGTILSVDYTNDAAIAKVKIAHPKAAVPYIDYFMLLKLEEGWKIIHKMYTKKIDTQIENEKELISQALMDYIDGTANGNANQIRKAFHPDLNLYTVDNGQLKVRDGKKYTAIFEDGKKRERVGKIISIDYTNIAAVAEVEIAVPSQNKSYTDYMMMLKTNGKWQIIHKSYVVK